MSYDLARGVVVMFGGVDSGNFPSSIANDTWVPNRELLRAARRFSTPLA